YDRIRKAAPSRISVAFMGESGTGKELLARALHHESPRRSGPFVALNCAAVPRDLLESQLFGHRRGAFTGAVDDQAGHFVHADGGTLFLDEIGEMDPALQAKLLRSLQEGTVLPVGAEHEVDVDVRIVAATNKDLHALVEDGGFREDLYYRIVAFPIEVPPLRERSDDVPALAFHFLAKHRADAGRPGIESITPEAVDALRNYDWPGNVRELENVIHQALLLTSSDDAIGLDGLPTEVLAGPGRHLGLLPPATGQRGWSPAATSGFHDPRTGQLMTLREIEDRAFRLALEEAGGNTTRAAKMLGVARATFYRRLGPKKRAAG
nr:sigma 54-interacting transcriptional regulator [Planctomycetota bacterium]